MQLFGKDLSRDVAIIAEIGVNHEGDKMAASRLIELAAASGADAVKFQTYTPERFVAANDTERLARVTRFALDSAALRQLAREAERAGVVLFSTAVTEDTVPFLAEFCPAIKIASGDLTFEPVIRAAAATGKPLIISTGIGSVEEIDRAVSWVRDEVGDPALASRLVLMHCVSAYPTPIEQANVLSVPFMAQRYGLTIGFSNHVIGPEACFAAVAVGARVVEVHFTDSKVDRTFRDHALSFEPADFAELVRAVRRVAASLGTHDKRPQECESPLRAATRKGIVAARDLPAGAVLGRDDLMFARPATEFTAHETSAVVGRTLHVALKRGQTIPRQGLS